MSLGFCHGQYYECQCLGCEHGDDMEHCDHDCCFKCTAAELYMTIKHDTPTYDIELRCCFRHAYPGHRCEHYIEYDYL